MVNLSIKDNKCKDGLHINCLNVKLSTLKCYKPVKLMAIVIGDLFFASVAAKIFHVKHILPLIAPLLAYAPQLSYFKINLNHTEKKL